MFINHDKKFVYLAISKTGTYSVHNFFGYNSGHPVPAEHHMGVRTLLEKYPVSKDYFKFAFVRNPWSKLVSTYMDFTLRRKNQYSEFVIHDKPLLSEFENFEDFCLRLKDSVWIKDIFFIPQIDLVTTEEGIPINFIGKFENMNNDFKVVCNKLNLGYRPLTHANKGLYNKDYRTYYSNKAKLAIEELYRDDIEIFNYEF